MVADKIIIQDGQTYKPGQEIPDMGSLIAIEVKGDIRSYIGLSKDEGKLPHYVGSGSSCMMLDTGDFYRFLESTDTWYRI